ncbi:hypothetical protein PO124_05495 [Bacillus licheniformis]|nr:hypothetical protein [Bacillus licheniformis]
MSAEALKHQYKVIVFQTFYQKQNELKVLELLKRKEVDGVMLCSLEMNGKTSKIRQIRSRGYGK